MSTSEIKKQILELQKQLEDANEIEKDKRREYLRLKQREYYNRNKEAERIRCREKQRDKYELKKILKCYNFLADLKTTNPEYLEVLEIKV